MSSRAFAEVAARAIAVVLSYWALSGAAYCAETTLPPQGAVVTVVTAINECFSAAVRVSGFLIARVEVVVRIEPDGSRITEVLVGDGDVVTTGQVMARLARPTYDMTNVAGEPSIRASPGTPGEPTARVEAAARPNPNLAGEPTRAQANEAGARTIANAPASAPNPPNTTPATVAIRAPVAGRVVESAASVGSTASLLGEPLFRIAVASEIEVEVEVPGIYVPILARGQTARVEVDDGRELSGHVRLVFVEVDPITQTGRARISVESDPSLLAGKFLRATIDARRSCGISIPRSAISYRADGTSVQAVRGDVIETRNVRVGLRSDLNAEILGGLAEGDVVVANAGTSLRNGDKVKPVFREKAD
jgi:HlyD family secretion protein